MGKNNFDFLRFAFALIVVFSHIVDLSLAPSLQFLKPFFDSHVSVTGFFVISGFLITSSYLRSSSMSSYFEKRARRLLPAYIMVIVLSVLIFSIFSSLSIGSYFGSKQLYAYLLSNLLFVNFIQPCLPGVFLDNAYCAVNGALWTIKVEVGFYLVLPLILYGLKHVPNKLMYLLGLYLLGLIYQYGLSYLMEVWPAKSNMLNTLKHQLPGYLTYFMAGIILFQYQDYIKQKRLVWGVIASVVFVVEYAVGMEVFRPLAMAILIGNFAFGFSYLNNFGKYGDVSYGIYILHFPIIQCLVSLGFFDLFNPFILLIAIVILVVLLGFLSWHLIESRFIKRRSLHLV
jgi:peptidoglycan/LPS O-acetylase OafA/YrhL